MPTAIHESSLFTTTQSTTYPYALILTTNSSDAQTMVMNITSLPTGAGYRVKKKVANGTAYLSGQTSLNLGSNTKTVSGVSFDRYVHIQFTSGDIEFDELIVNGTTVYPEAITQANIQTAVDAWVSDQAAATATYGEINTWDTSQVTDMSELFKNKTNFNSNISNWDVSNVTSMYRMFYYAENFNQDIGNWTIVGNVNMREMFANARVFNKPLANWERTHSTGTTTITVTVDGSNKYVLNGNTAVKPVLQVGHTYIFDVSDNSNSNHPLVFHSDESGTVFNNVTTSGQAGQQGATVTFEPQQTGDVYLYCANHGYGMGSYYNTITVTSSSSTLASVTDMYGMFRGASDFNQDISQWDVSQVTTVERMFQNAINFNQPLQYWDTTSVTNYDNKFQGATAMLAIGFPETPDSSHFNIFRIGDPMTNTNIQTAVDAWVNNEGAATTTYGDINTWDTSAVTDMSNLFSTTRNGSMSTFNSNISNWNTSNVTNMSNMFSGAQDFNQDISNWNTSNVTNMSNMFNNAKKFNNGDSGNNSANPLTTSGSSWDVSSVTNMSGMFFKAYKFNQDVSNWNVSSVENMSTMFRDAVLFNQNISSWTVSNVRDTWGMFYGNPAFNQDISIWDTSQVTSMSWMFYNASSMDQPLQYWNTSSVTSYQNMFLNATNMLARGFSATPNSSYFNQPRPFKPTTKQQLIDAVTAFTSIGGDANVYNNVPINDWDTSLITDMSYLFQDKSTFNSDISGWVVSSVTNMYGMFWGAEAFNQAIGQWDVSQVTNVARMFQNAIDFDQSIQYWDTTSVDINTGYINMFSGATAMLARGFSATPSSTDFNKFPPMTNDNIQTAVDLWVSNQSSATATYGDISTWDTSAVTDMSNLFNGKSTFNSDISGWDVSSVTNMNNMFKLAGQFNTDISDWDVSSVTNMHGMFRNTVFNKPIGTWNISSVTNMSYMFYSSHFNEDLSFWDVSNVTNFTSMFELGRYGALGSNSNPRDPNDASVSLDGVLIKYWAVSANANLNGIFRDARNTQVTMRAGHSEGPYNKWFSTAHTEAQAQNHSKFNVQGRSPNDYIAFGYTLAQLFTIFTSAQLRSEEYTAQQLFTAQASSSYMKGGFTVSELITGGYQLNSGTNDNMKLLSGFTVSELSSQFSVSDMKTASVSASDMKTAFDAGSYTISQITTGGYLLGELLTAAFSVSDLSSQFTATDMKTASVSATDMKTAFDAESYTISQITTAGYLLGELLTAAFSVSDLSSQFTASEMKTASVSISDAKAGTYTLAQLKASSYTFSEITSVYTFVELSESDGYTVLEMKSENVTAANIKIAFDAGNYTISQIKLHYGIGELLAANFTMAHLSATGGFSVAQMKTANRSAADMKLAFTAENYTISQIKASYSITELFVTNGFSITELSSSGGFSVAQMKTASISAANIKLAFTDGNYTISQIKTGGYTLIDTSVSARGLLQAFSVAELKNDFSAADMFNASVSAVSVRPHYTLSDIINGGYDLVDTSVTGRGLLQAFTIANLKNDFTATQMNTAGVSIADAKTGTYSLAELKDSSYTFTEITSVYTFVELSESDGYTVSEMKSENVTAANIKIAFDAENYDISQIKAGGYSIAELLAGNFTMTHLSAAGGFSVSQMRSASISAANIKGFYDISTLKAGGYTLVDSSVTARGLLQAFSVAELKNNFSANEMKAAGKVVADLYDSVNSSFHYTTEQLSNAYSISELTVDHGVLEIIDISPHFSVSQMFTAQVSAADIKPSVGNTTGYTITTLKANGYVLVDSSVAGRGLLSAFSITELKNDFSATEMNTAGVSIADAKTGTYSLGQLKASSYTFTEISGEYTYGELSAGYTELEMFNENVSAANIRIAIENGSNFTLASVKSVGTYTLVDSSVAAKGLLQAFTVTELKDDYSAKEMFDANVSAADVKTNYSVTILKNTGTYTLVDSNVAAKGMLQAFSVTELKDDYTAKEMFDANVSAADVKTNYTVTILKNIGTYTLVDSNVQARGMLEAFSVAELKDDYSATEMQSASVSPNNLKGFYAITDITSAYGISVLTQEGTSFTLTDFKGQIAISTLKPQYSVAQFKAALYTASDLSSDFTISELKPTYSLNEMKEGFSIDIVKLNYTLFELFPEYTTTELINAGFTRRTQLESGAKISAEYAILNEVFYN